MAKLLVRDKHGIQREVTKRAYDLVGHKYGYEIIGQAKEPEREKTEVQKAMDEIRAKKAAQQEKIETIAEDTPQEFSPDEPVNEPKKRGRKPKTQAE
jgi:hypothetical protein